MTLNILLSFAQFERELAGERIRDKFAASRAKGMWMGGSPPLGYDVRDRKLVMNPAEAELVRLIIRRFLDLGSALLLIRELNAEGHRTKSWMTHPRGPMFSKPGAGAPIMTGLWRAPEHCHGRAAGEPSPICREARLIRARLSARPADHPAARHGGELWRETQSK